jgi:hypothetical protein
VTRSNRSITSAAKGVAIGVAHQDSPTLHVVTQASAPAPVEIVRDKPEPKPRQRPLRVLHIGNIANYAYNIARVLQTDDIVSDAISWDYYHINARPIWEDGDFDSADTGDQYFPRLPGAFEAKFDEPEWYFHGPRRLACHALIARNEGRHALSQVLRRLNERYMRRIADPVVRESQGFKDRTRAAEIIAEDLNGGFGAAQWPGHLENWLASKPHTARLRKFAAALNARAKVNAAPPSVSSPVDAFEGLVEREVASYRALWPDREIDPMLVRQFGNDVVLMARLMAHYDVIIGYAIDGIWPLIAGRKYLAYEFGTIRNLPFEDGIMGKLASIVYRNCSEIIVTNCDNEVPAKRLARPYRFLPHVINENWMVESASDLRAVLVSRHGGNFFIYHPSRQHWDETRNTNWDKGNDKLLRAFAGLVHNHGVDARCIAVNWGTTLAESKSLVKELGVADKMIWIEPQPHRRMMRYVAAADVIVDQFTIPTFGGIPPKAFHASRPVVTCFDPALHQWCFEEMPPLLPACEPAGIEAALLKLARNPAYARELGAKGNQWYQRENSNARIRTILSRIVHDAADSQTTHASRAAS